MIAITVGELVHGAAGGSGIMSDTPQVLPAYHLKALKLPTLLREYERQGRPAVRSCR